MAKNQQEKAVEAPAQPVIEPAASPAVSDDSMTAYGVTVGELVATADRMRNKWLEEQNKTKALEDSNGELGNKVQNLEHAVSVLESAIKIKDADIEKKAGEITDLRNLKAPPTPQQVAEAIRKQQSEAADTGLVRKEDGSIVTVVTIPPESAEPLLSWADTAGEDPVEYIQKTLGEALLQYTSS